MRTKTFLLISLTLLFILAACSPATVDEGDSETAVPVEPTESTETSELEGSSWVLSGIQAADVAPTTEIDQEITAVFQDGQITGSAGCNSYFAGYETDGIDLTLSGLGNTAMFCDEARNQRENEFLAALQTITGYRLDGDTLMLLDADGTVVIEMRSVELIDETADSEQLLGIWQLRTFEDSASGEESNDITIADPTKYTLELMADGSYAIQADCNSGSGQYTANGSSLQLEPGPITLAACGPDSVSNTYVSLLGDVVTFVFNGEDNLILNLKADAGNMIFSQASETASDLEGTNWVLNSLVTEGGITSTEIDQEITAVFQDGRLTGSAGCNSYFGGYEIEGDSLTLNGMGNTAMACDEVHNQRESEFLAALQIVTGYRLDGDRLMLLDVESSVVIEMQAVEIVGIWQWQVFEDSASGDESNDITVTDPTKYTLELRVDGSYTIQADCNSGNGQYTVNGSSLTLEPGPITLAECGPESLSNLFVSKLNEVVTFVFDSDGNLVLNLRADSGNMIFSPAK